MDNSAKRTSQDFWSENLVGLTEPSNDLVHEFIAILNDASDERPLQAILSKNPVLMRALLPPSRCLWCFDRPRFGSEYIPDFLLCYEYSTGLNWILIELENPTKTALNSNGRMSSALIEAIGQIDDWRIWLRQNIAYAHSQLGLKEINAECPSIIIIGRRVQLNPKHINRYKELSKNNLTVMTYDRLVGSAKSIAKLRGW